MVYCRKLALGVMLLSAIELAAGDAVSYKKEIQPILENYCFSCHGEGVSKGKFSMDEFDDLAKHLDDREHWMAIWRNVRSQVMPPSDEDQLTAEESRKLQSWIEREVFDLDPENPDPGRVTIRRLNRTEYKHAVFDLLGVEYDTADVFPPDDTGYGFDNIGDVLSISPLLMEKYISAAEEVVNLALPEGAAAQVPRVDIDGAEFVAPGNPKVNGKWLAFNREQSVKASRMVQWDGEYEIRMEYAIKGAVEATVHEADLVLEAAGNKLTEASLGWDQRRSIDLTATVGLKKGMQEFEIKMRPGREPAEGEEELFFTLQRVILRGPLGGQERDYGKGYRMILVDGPPPEGNSARQGYARKIMRSFVSRAFRKPLDDVTINRLVKMVDEVQQMPGKTFEDGIKQAIATCLASPRFLFRVEIQPEPNNSGKVVALDDYSLASRLSFFLWGSVPDDELLSLAFNKKLRQELRPQIDRMLEDPRSARMVESFTGQWLQARDLENLPVSAKEILGLESNRDAARVFDVRLREDMKRETEMFFDFVLRKDRPAEELISARYSFLNERLAKFYGIEGVEGEAFRAVDLTEHPERGGLLTQGTVLMVSSNPTRTSPVKRGLFVLDNLLGTPAPPAPPDVPPLEESAEGSGAPPTMREMMEVHRKNPDCRGCHQRMDPIGLGLENFNALGQFRQTEHGKKIDAAGQLLTGEKFSNVAELKEILAEKRRVDFYRCLSDKLLTYAIGRGMEYYDSTTINQLVERLEKNDGKLRELIYGIAESAPFQKRRGDD